MRSKIIVLSLVGFMALVVWFFSPDQVEVAGVGGAGLRKTERAQSFASVAPVVVAAGSAPADARTAEPVAAYAKPVGAHQGAPVFFRHRDAAAVGGNDKTPFDRLARLKLGPGVDIGGKRRRVIAARAVPEGQDFSQVGTLAFKDKGFNIVATDAATDTNFSSLPFHTGAKPVVMNPANGRVGIVTGTLIVKIADSGAADRLAGQEGFQTLHYDPATQLAYFKVPEGYEITPGAARVRKTAGVARVEVEVLEGFKEAK